MTSRELHKNCSEMVTLATMTLSEKNEAILALSLLKEKQSTRITELEVALEEALKDTARLNKLDESSDHSAFDHTGNGEYFSCGGKHAGFKPVREAIDSIRTVKGF